MIPDSPVHQLNRQLQQHRFLVATYKMDLSLTNIVIILSKKTHQMLLISLLKIRKFANTKIRKAFNMRAIRIAEIVLNYERRVLLYSYLMIKSRQKKYANKRRHLIQSKHKTPPISAQIQKKKQAIRIFEQLFHKYL